MYEAAYELMNTFPDISRGTSHWEYTLRFCIEFLHRLSRLLEHPRSRRLENTNLKYRQKP